MGKSSIFTGSVSLLCCLAVCACAQGPQSSQDSGQVIDAARDSGSSEHSSDDAAAGDAEWVGRDAGAVDAGAAGRDASAADAGALAPDAGSYPPPDAGALAPDAGAYPPPDAGALAADAGAFPPDVQVTKLYQLILDRDPDAAGLQYWSGELAAQRKTIDDIIVAFLSSDEFHQKVLSFATPTDFILYTFDKLLRRSPTSFQQRTLEQLSGGTAVVDTMARASFQMVLNSNQCRAANPEIFPAPQAIPTLAAPDCAAEGFDETIYLDVDPDIDLVQGGPEIDTIGNNGANTVEYWSPTKLSGQGVVVIKFTTDQSAPASFGQSYIVSHVSAVEYPATQIGRNPHLIISDSPCDWNGAGSVALGGYYYLGQSPDSQQTSLNTLQAGRTYFLIVTHRNPATGDSACAGDATLCNLRISTPNFTRPHFLWVDHGAGVW